MSIDMQNMSSVEITQLIAALEAELKNRVKEEKQKLISELKDKASSLNISIQELLEEVTKSKKRTTGTPVKIKYRNTDNPSETWSGRGHKPKWLVAQINKGRNKSDFLV